MADEDNYEGFYSIEVQGDTAHIRRMDRQDLTEAEIRRLKRLLRVFDEEDAKLERSRPKG